MPILSRSVVTAFGPNAASVMKSALASVAPILQNQIIKATLERMTKTEGVAAHLRDQIAAILFGLSDIRSISLMARDFGRVQLHGNNAGYGFLLRVCALAYEALLPELGTGRFRFRDVLADPQTMGLIFQDFVRNFFRLQQNRFAVKGEQIDWLVNASAGFGHGLVPRMHTDTSLYDGTRTIIIECKWTPTALQTVRGTKTLVSGHLYQLHAYMTNHSRGQRRPSSVEGLLLYPLSDEAVDVAVRVKDQWIRVHTLDLQTDWQQIRSPCSHYLTTHR